MDRFSTRRAAAFVAVAILVCSGLPQEGRAQGGAMMGAPLFELTVPFAHGSAVLTGAASRRLSQDFKRFPYSAQSGAIVTGTAAPSEKGGEALAQQRADVVFDALVKLGASPDTLREGDNRVGTAPAARVTAPPQ